MGCSYFAEETNFYNDFVKVEIRSSDDRVTCFYRVIGDDVMDWRIEREERWKVACYVGCTWY